MAAPPVRGYPHVTYSPWSDPYAAHVQQAPVWPAPHEYAQQPAQYSRRLFPIPPTPEPEPEDPISDYDDESDGPDFGTSFAPPPAPAADQVSVRTSGSHSSNGASQRGYVNIVQPKSALPSSLWATYNNSKSKSKPRPRPKKKTLKPASSAKAEQPVDAAKVAVIEAPKENPPAKPKPKPAKPAAKEPLKPGKSEFYTFAIIH